MGLNVMRAVMRLSALIVLLFVASSAHAYPASTAWSVTTGGPSCTYSSPLTFASAAAACASITSEQGVGYMKGSCSFNTSTNSWTYTGVSGVSCRGTVTLSGWPFGNGTFTDQQGGIVGSGLGCPNGGTLAGSVCTCPAGYTDTGTGCVAVTCPAVGTSVGTLNVTWGWALSSTPGASDIVTQNSASSIYGDQCRSTSSGFCPVALDPAHPQMANAWRSQEPSATGLYRISVDVPFVSTGTTACTEDTTDPIAPTSGSPACPTGNVGTVNGKAVCLGTMPAQGINFGTPEKGGNPRANTSPTADSNSGREPSAASGGGPDARGGPGVTVSPDGFIGTGNNRSGTGTSGTGSSSGSPLTLPTDYQRDATGQITNTKLQTIITDGLKVKEDGTPSGAGALDASKTALGDATKAGTDGVGAAVTGTGDKDTGWKISWGAPTSCTNPPAFVLPHANLNWTPDLCAYSSQIGAVMSFLWLLFTLSSCLAMIRSTAAGGV